MASLTKTGVTKLHRQLQAARSMAKRHRDRVETAVDQAVSTLETTGAGFALGAAKANGMEEVMGVPLPLVSALAMHGTALLVGGDAARHLTAFGNGAAAVYGYQLAQETFGDSAPGEVSGQGLPDSELRDL